MTTQILWGSLMLFVCSLLHVSFLIITIIILQRISAWFDRSSATVRIAALISGGFGAIVGSHTIQVWLWAISFVVMSALPDIDTSIYFALTTYTTLGYGDITVGNDVRIFAAMASVTGLLNFGLSTAFLVGVFTNMLPPHLSNHVGRSSRNRQADA